MTHATISLLNFPSTDSVEIERTPRGLIIRHRRKNPGQPIAVHSVTVQDQALNRPYDGFDPLGTILDELKERMDADDRMLTNC